VLGQLFFIVKDLMKIGVGISVLLFQVHAILLKPINLTFNELSLFIFFRIGWSNWELLLESRTDVSESSVRNRRIILHKVSKRSTHSSATMDSTIIAIVSCHWPWNFGRVGAKVALHTWNRSGLRFVCKAVLVENDFLFKISFLVIFYHFN
jgi:hypothetical protein